LELNWTESENALYYNVHIDGTVVATGITSTSYTIEKSSTRTYEIFVKAVNNVNDTETSSNTIFITILPFQITGVDLSFNTPNLLSISYNIQQGASDYNIYITTINGLIKIEGVRANPYQYSLQAINAGLVEVKVSGVNSAGEGPLSTTVSGTYYPKITVSDLSYNRLADDDSILNITWAPPNTTQFFYYRIAILVNEITSTYDISGINITSYQYQMKTYGTHITNVSMSYDGNIFYDPTRIFISVDSTTQPPKAPTDFQITSRTGEFNESETSLNVHFSWTQPFGAERYEIYYDENIHSINLNESTTVINFTTEGPQTFTIKAINSYGESVASSPITTYIYLLISAPRNFQATPGDSQAIFTWVEPSSIPHEFSNYTLTITGDAFPRIFDISSNSTTYTATGLNNNISYSATIRANDPIILSEFASTSSFTPIASSSSPAAPQNLRRNSVQPFYNGGVDISGRLYTIVPLIWDSVSGTGITYNVYVDNTLLAEKIQPTSFEARSYSSGPIAFSVRAVNANGQLSASTTLTLNIPAPPSTVRDIQLSPGNNAMILTWTNPLIIPRLYTNITTYIFDRTGGANTFIGTLSPSPRYDQNHYLITQTDNGTRIQNGKSYSVLMFVDEGSLIKGPQATSSIVNVSGISSLTPPNPPTTVRVLCGFTSRRNNIFGIFYTVGFTQSFIGDLANFYQIYINDQAVGTRVFDISLNTISKTLFTTIPGTYKIQVAGTNFGGEGPKSDPIYEQIDPIVAPTNVSVVPGIKSLNVSWSPPLSPPRPITGYSVIASLNGATVAYYTVSDPAIREAKLYGLTGGTAYNVSVSALPSPSFLSSPIEATPLSQISEGNIIGNLANVNLGGVRAGTATAGPRIVAPFTGKDVSSNVILPSATEGTPVSLPPLSVAGVSAALSIYPQKGASRVAFSHEQLTKNEVDFVSAILPAEIPVKRPLPSGDAFTIVSIDGSGQQLITNETKLDATDLIRVRGYTNPILLHVNEQGVPDKYYRPTAGIFTFTENPTFILVEGGEETTIVNDVVDDVGSCICAVREYVQSGNSDRTLTREMTTRSNNVIARDYVSNPTSYRQMDSSSLLRIRMGLVGRGR
jgi:hypothetical protein